jgi:hypothetical protein
MLGLVHHVHIIRSVGFSHRHKTGPERVRREGLPRLLLEVMNWEKLFWFLKFLNPKLIVRDPQGDALDVPISVFDEIREGTATRRQQYFNEFTIPFYG